MVCLNIWLQNINLGQDGDNGESNADDKVDGGEELVKLALARVLPGVVGDQKGEGSNGSAIPEC